MPILQISVTLENAPGVLSDVSERLGKQGINIGAISLADSSDTSTVRFICDDPEKAANVLKDAGYEIKRRQVLAVETPDHPGGLNAVLKPLAKAGVNVLYLYPYLRRAGDNAILIIRVDNAEKATEILKAEWISVLDEELYSI
jgi:hypothetical protein